MTLNRGDLVAKVRVTDFADDPDDDAVELVLDEAHTLFEVVEVVRGLSGDEDVVRLLVLR